MNPNIFSIKYKLWKFNLIAHRMIQRYLSWKLVFAFYFYTFWNLYLITAYDLATQCPSRRASARRHAAKYTIPLPSFTGTTSLPQSRSQSRQHAGLTDSTLSQGPSPNISLNPSPNCSPQPRAPRQPRRAHTIAHDSKNMTDKTHEWEDDVDKVRNAMSILLLFSFE